MCEYCVCVLPPRPYSSALLICASLVSRMKADACAYGQQRLTKGSWLHCRAMTVLSQRLQRTLARALLPLSRQSFTLAQPTLLSTCRFMSRPIKTAERFRHPLMQEESREINCSYRKGTISNY